MPTNSLCNVRYPLIAMCSPLHSVWLFVAKSKHSANGLSRPCFFDSAILNPSESMKFVEALLLRKLDRSLLHQILDESIDPHISNSNSLDSCAIFNLRYSSNDHPLDRGSYNPRTAEDLHKCLDIPNNSRQWYPTILDPRPVPCRTTLSPRTHLQDHLQ